MPKKLPHIQNFEATRNNYEFVSDANFNITFIPPASLGGGFEVLSEHVLNFSGLEDTDSSEPVQQQFAQARANFASDDTGDNTVNLTITLSLFLNKAVQNYVYKKIKSWRKLVFNSQTGERGIKENYVGSIVAQKWRRDGEEYWTREVKNVFPTSNLPDLGEGDVTAGDPKTLSTTWVGDYYIEQDR